MSHTTETIVFTPELTRAIVARLFHMQRTPSAEPSLMAQGFDPADFYRAIDDVRRAEQSDAARDMSRKHGGKISVQTCSSLMPSLTID